MGLRCLEEAELQMLLKIVEDEKKIFNLGKHRIFLKSQHLNLMEI
jgi:hypothetical protein